jgi:hypothetical protein
MPHVNPFMQKYVDENINVFYRSEIDAMNKYDKIHGEDSINHYFTLVPDSFFVRGLSCTLYRVHCEYGSDYPTYFLIKDNENNQVYKYCRSSFGMFYDNKIYTPTEALVFMKNRLISPFRQDLCDIESFLNRSEALKFKLLTKELLDSLPIHKDLKRIKTQADLDQFWKDLHDRDVINSDKIDYKNAKIFLKLIGERINLSNVLIYNSRSSITAPELTYIDFSSKIQENAEGLRVTEEEKNYIEKKLVKGNLYKLRVFTVSFLK